MKKNKWLIFIGFILLIIVVGVLIGYHLDSKNQNQKNDSEKNKELNQKEAKESITNLIDSFFDENMTKKSVAEITNNEVYEDMIVFGKDSYLQTTLPTKYNKNGELDSYLEKQKNYAKVIQKKIKKNTTYHFGEYMITEEGDAFLTIYIKPYYYNIYIADLNTLKGKLLTYAGYSVHDDFDKISQKRLKDDYKAKVKAMEILNDYLDVYQSKEEITYQITFPGKKISNQDYFSIYMHLQGYSTTDFDSGTLPKQSEDRVQYYIDEAIKKKVLDSKNSLKLK